MRVTHVITRLVVGGAQENTVATVLGLRRQTGLAVDLISGPTTGPEGSLESAFAADPKVLTIFPQLVRPVHPWKDRQALMGLTDIFQHTRPDIVHTHSGKAGIIGRLAAKYAGVPVILHTIHGPSFGPFQNFAANFVFTAAEKYAARVTDHFTVVADAMKQQYLAAGIGRPEQYTKIYSGFPLEPFLTAANQPTLRARYGLQPDDFVVGKIARLFALKGHDDLFAAAPELVRRCPRLKFLLVGDGQWRARLAGLARAQGLEKHFVFTGLVPPAEVPALVGIMDALVHLSLREGLPRALPQALAAARPVIAYDCDGAREVCRDGQTGFLLRPGDLAGLTERLLQLAGQPALRAQMGLRGQALVRENFAVEKMVADTHALYLKLAAERGVRA
jgi:glycosyltransferase involved in cell wall biosynthesis